MHSHFRAESQTIRGIIICVMRNFYSIHSTDQSDNIASHNSFDFITKFSFNFFSSELGASPYPYANGTDISAILYS